jgi:hypothetical protein
MIELVQVYTCIWYTICRLVNTSSCGGSTCTGARKGETLLKHFSDSMITSRIQATYCCLEYTPLSSDLRPEVHLKSYKDSLSVIASS